MKAFRIHAGWLKSERKITGLFRINTAFRLFFLGVILLGSFRPTIAQFNAERAFGFLVKQVAFGPRNPGSAGHAQCLQYLKDELQDKAERLRVQPFDYQDAVTGKQYKMTNLIASFKPQESRRIFFAAHWDTRPRADYETKANREKPILGANDGASGVAVLLEIAAQLNFNPPPIGVDLILFDGEDYGREGHLEEYFLGSRYFAVHAADYHPRYGILLDMIGDANLNIPREVNSQKNLPQIMDKVWDMAHSLGYWEFEDEQGSYVNDDHVILMEHGIPCIDIIDFNYPDRTHRYWHTLQDTPDKCSAQSLKIIGDVMLELIYNEK
jgi:hypothetical protein